MSPYWKRLSLGNDEPVCTSWPGFRGKDVSHCHRVVTSILYSVSTDMTWVPFPRRVRVKLPHISTGCRRDTNRLFSSSEILDFQYSGLCVHTIPLLGPKTTESYFLTTWVRRGRELCSRVVCTREGLWGTVPSTKVGNSWIDPYSFDNENSRWIPDARFYVVVYCLEEGLSESRTGVLFERLEV